MKPITLFIRQSFSVGGFLAILFAAGLNSGRAQDTLVKTDLTWVYSNNEEPGWQQLNFDDSGWSPVLNLGQSCSPNCAIGGDHYGNIYLLPYTAYLRKEFIVGNVTGPILMSGGEDDDVDIYINGSLAFSDNNHLAGVYNNIDVTSFITPNAANIIAVKHTDWYCCGYVMGLFIVSGISPACTVPPNLSVTNITSSSAKLNWDAISGAEGYKIRYKVSGTNLWTINYSWGNSKNLNNLSPNTDYTWEVKTFCTIAPGLSSDWSAKQHFTTGQLRLGDEPVEQTSFQIYPNPAEDHATIQFTLAQPSHVCIRVYDLSGKEISALFDAELQQGAHSLPISTRNFSKGVYTVKMISDFGIQNQKFIVQ